jgi:hypothetical protein
LGPSRSTRRRLSTRRCPSGQVTQGEAEVARSKKRMRGFLCGPWTCSRPQALSPRLSAQWGEQSVKENGYLDWGYPVGSTAWEPSETRGTRPSSRRRPPATKRNLVEGASLRPRFQKALPRLREHPFECTHSAEWRDQLRILRLPIVRDRQSGFSQGNPSTDVRQETVLNTSSGGGKLAAQTKEA